MNARYVILRVLMEADSTMINIENLTGEDGQPDLLIKLNREKIKTTGKEAIANFLMRLQVNNSRLLLFLLFVFSFRKLT